MTNDLDNLRPIDKPKDITPGRLRHEAFDVEYAGRKHAADLLRWCADKIEEQDEMLVRARRVEPQEMSIYGWWYPADEIDEALEWLDRALNLDVFPLIYVQNDDNLKNIRHTEGFQALMKKHFPDQYEKE